jgi:hypothetical protein
MEIPRGSVALTVNRRGTFKVKPTAKTPGQCGASGQTQYEYLVRITCSNKKLQSPHNFVLDNALVHGYWVDMYERDGELAHSCETMALSAVDHFYQLFTGSNPPCQGMDLLAIEVELHGSKASFISARWTKSLGRPKKTE